MHNLVKMLSLSENMYSKKCQYRCYFSKKIFLTILKHLCNPYDEEFFRIFFLDSVPPMTTLCIKTLIQVLLSNQNFQLSWNMYLAWVESIFWKCSNFSYELRYNNTYMLILDPYTLPNKHPKILSAKCRVFLNF